MSLPEANLEAIRCWLMASNEWPDREQLVESKLRAFLADAQDELDRRPASELEHSAKEERDEARRHRLLTWKWESRRISLKEFGPWRTVGDALPIEACRNSVVEAAAFLIAHPVLGPDSSEAANQRYGEHVCRIRCIQSFADAVRDCRLLSVLVAERDQRGREGCQALRYSSEDGSHRGIALALVGYDTVQAWVGNPI
jgi:hypothetical protein